MGTTGLCAHHGVPCLNPHPQCRSSSPITGPHGHVDRIIFVPPSYGSSHIIPVFMWFILYILYVDSQMDIRELFIFLVNTATNIYLYKWRQAKISAEYFQNQSSAFSIRNMWPLLELLIYTDVSKCQGKLDTCCVFPKDVFRHRYFSKDKKRLQRWRNDICITTLKSKNIL